jgi:predicted P-loop ATPase
VSGPTDEPGDKKKAPRRRSGSGKGNGASPPLRAISGDNAPEPWHSELRMRVNRSGEIEAIPCVENARLFLLNHVAFKGCWGRNEMTWKVELRRELPALGSGTGKSPGVGAELTDEALTWCRIAMWERCGLSVGKDPMAEAIEIAAAERAWNPLTEWLGALEWDGEHRLNSWLSRYLGAEQSAYTREAGRAWLISAIARAFRPGCKADHVLVLEGPQGAGKSTAVRILGGDWTLEKLPNIRDPERAAFAICGKWLGEISELDAFKGARATAIKEFLTIQEDHFRPPYGRYFVTRKRTIVFIATTNDHVYLHDETGARRFFPVECGKIDLAGLTRDRDRLWAEARLAFESGARWWLDATGEADARVEQSARYDEDSWTEKIVAWLDRPGYDGSIREKVSIGEVLSDVFELDPADWDRANQTRVGQTLARLGWAVERHREQGVKVRRYRRGPRTT